MIKKYIFTSLEFYIMFNNIVKLLLCIRSLNKIASFYIDEGEKTRIAKFEQKLLKDLVFGVKFWGVLFYLKSQFLSKNLSKVKWGLIFFFSTSN